MTSRLAAALLVGGAAFLPTVVPPGPDTDDRTVPIERETRGIVRQVVPYDGRTARTDGGRVTVVLDTDVLFEFDRADLTPGAAAALDTIGADLADRATGEVTVVGHTDALGAEDYNLDLSRRRAETVRAVLEPAAEGAVTFAVSGRGEAEPVAANAAPDGSDDPEGRRRNRRVELEFTVVEE